MRLISAVSTLFLLERASGQGCYGGVKGVTYLSDDDKCNCYSTACTKDTCEGDMGGTWTDDCPRCDPAKCDPLAVETEGSDANPSCTGPAEMIDRFGKKMYRRKLIYREIPDTPEFAGKFCHIILELCPGESQLTHGMDSGFGDFYRIAATTELQDLKSRPDDPSYTYSGMHKPTGARSYSPVTPLSENTVQLTLKEVTSGDGSKYDCTPGVDCEYGMTELACMAPIGSEFLLSKRPDHQGYQGTHMAYVPNFSREPGMGPYTVNVIGQGVALTEVNILSISELFKPFAVDGSFSNIKEVNYLWANSYWESASWMFEDTESSDLSREMIRLFGSYGIRFKLMHAISRQDRPEADFYSRVDVDVLGEAFNLTNTTDQDPNIKWFIVGSSDYKKSIYPLILEWGFDMQPCPKAESKGYPYCGPNALYNQLPPGDDPNERERSDVFKFFEAQPTEPGMTNVDITISFDAYPMDISWVLYDTCDGKTELASGDNYGRPLYMEHVTTSLSTTEAEFVLEIEDAYGDGLCCDYGLGNFFIDVNGDEVYRSKMEDPSSGEVVRFKSPHGCNYEPPDDGIPMEITINFDQFPEDISWELFNTCAGPAGELLGEGRGYGQVDAFQSVTVFDQHVEDGTFLFVIKDSFGDGLCCTYGDGSYVIIANNGAPIISSFEMMSEEAIPFGSEDNCSGDVDDTRASFSSEFGVPGCGTASDTGICTTVGTGLLVAKTVSGEPNGPNTLDGCTDGRDGAHMVDESVEAITVSSVTGEFEPKQMAAGGSAKITAHVNVFCNPNVEDVVDFFTTSDEGEDGPEWKYVGTTVPTACGLVEVESDTFTLTASPGQAVRAIVRWVGSGDPAPKACPDESNTYTDTDDLVFAIAPAHSACYDFTTHKCKCTKDTCTKEKCNALPGGIWTNTCPEACTCPEFDPPTPAPTPEPGPTEGAACYDISVHKCKCTAELCDKELCEAANMIWTDTCVGTDSTPEACSCDQFDGILGIAPPAPVGMPAETECAGYSETRCLQAASVGCVWEDGACS